MFPNADYPWRFAAETGAREDAGDPSGAAIPARGAAPVFASAAKQSSSTTLAEVALPWVTSLRS
jgi:hypothetical protein